MKKFDDIDDAEVIEPEEIEEAELAKEADDKTSDVILQIRLPHLILRAHCWERQQAYFSTYHLQRRMTSWTL